MDWIRNYLISVIAAAAVCGICISLTKKNKSCGNIIKTLGGILLAITMIAPLAKVRLGELTDYFSEMSVDGGSIAEEGSVAAYNEMATGIKQTVETYILDKADTLGAQINVDIMLDRGSVPTPWSVKINGSVSPYDKRVLGEYISDRLGIPEERQEWN